MNIALILSGGTGTRAGGNIPKQYIAVCGRPVIGYCLDVFWNHPKIDAVQIVADCGWREVITAYMEEMRQRRNGWQENKAAAQKYCDKWRGFSEPGKNRQLSILNGLQDILCYADRADTVIIHDAARPLVSEKQITACIEAVRAGHDGALPVLPMKDTVYFSEDGGRITSLLERDKLFAGQAPESFVLGKYYEANKALMPDRILGINGSTEPAVLAGMDVIMIEGDERNFKITTQEDLQKFHKNMMMGITTTV